MKKILLIGIAGLLMAGCGKKEPTEAELNSFRELKAQESVKALLKDPSSAEFRNMNGMCGEVNSKNSFGAYTGFVRFIGTPDITVIEGENPQVDQATFNEVWKKMC
ncbi:hypothetical protein [Acinetobacter johnsonii]|uniref:hypothetical protein n=1 Tax=Acinetobacter johnsonii TaxID=40214 RepID=UPI0024499C0F|nr:hypothetical protein [Acinetobacter johnsonii]MDH1406211.1 hypothetical protein [Acinetobacter johnsonii]